MKADTKSLLKDIALTTLVLVIIAVLAGAILGGINKVTYQTPKEKLDMSLKKVYPDASKFDTMMYDAKNAANSKIDYADERGRVMGLYLPTDSDKGDVIIHVSGNGAYSKTIEIMVIINGNSIVDIKKHRSGETPGLGAKAFDKEHIDKYLGDFSDVDKFELSKKNPNAAHKIDAVTAATKTSTAFNNAVNLAISFYRSDEYKELTGGAEA